MQAIDVRQHHGDKLELVRRLEQGDILFYPETPFEIAEEDRNTLLNAGQADGNFHKNISYKPVSDRLAGLGTAVPGEEEKVKRALRNYSAAAVQWMREILAPYSEKWKLDYASFRSIEEEGRNLNWKKRNDLLHTDAFPTRPTNGGLILRCFTNINPTQDRIWMTGEPFAKLAREWAMPAGLEQVGARTLRLGKPFQRAATRALQRLHLPVVDRSPYDEFMLGFHNFLKSNDSYQKETTKYRLAFPPNSTWLVFTDVVPHSVLSGRYALEQTMIVARDSLLQPECAPASILEKLCGRKLTD